MAKLLRLHLTSVGHKDARYFPLTLDFRSPGGCPADTVVWLRNGGGKSSLMNLFYSTFLPESRKFLGSKAESRERRLADYVKATDLACVVTEWEMPRGTNLFSTTRIVGQVLAWHGGSASTDESRLDREFFTFRGSDVFPFESLPLHGLGIHPVSNLQEFRDWLAEMETKHRGLELERCNQRQKALWREKLDRIGIDTELFNYQLTMNVREGGAANLFEIKDTMEFVDLFLEMAMPPQPCVDAAAQINKVREKLLKLPLRELEDRFLTAVLGEFRPLAHEAATLQDGKIALREQRISNDLLRAAIDESISSSQTKLSILVGELTLLERRRSEVSSCKVAKQEYRLNYDSLYRELVWKEAQQAREAAENILKGAKHRERIADAALRWSEICRREAELAALCEEQEALFAEQKPVLDDLHKLGAAYAAALDAEVAKSVVLLDEVRSEYKRLLDKQSTMNVGLREARASETQAKEQLEVLKQRLSLRDQRRAVLRDEGLLLTREKAPEALRRMQSEIEQVKCEAAAAETRRQEITGNLEQLQSEEGDLKLRSQQQRTRADELNASWVRGVQQAEELRANRHIREVLSSDSPELDFPELPQLLRERESRILEEILRERIDHADDERTLRSMEAERLFPPSREVELVLSYLRECGMRTALPAYRFLAGNLMDVDASRNLLASDPARFSGVVVTSAEEFQIIQRMPLPIPGLRHPVVITLSELSESQIGNEGIVALPDVAGAFNYGSAAALQGDIEERVAKFEEHLYALEQNRAETAQAATEVERYRREFSSGRLLQLATERDQHIEEITRLNLRLEAIDSERTSLRAEMNACRAIVDRTAARLIQYASDVQRIRSYHDEYEQHEDNWLLQREERLATLDRLAGEIIERERIHTHLGSDIEAVRARINVHEQTHRQLMEERAQIIYSEATVAAQVYSLESARTRYGVSLARFQERFGQNAIAGKIEVLQEDLARLRGNHDQESQGLDTTEISDAARHPDLAHQRHIARDAHFKAHSAFEQAEHALTLAESERKGPRGYKQGLGIPPGAPEPRTSAEAAACRDELDVEIGGLQAQLEELDATRASKRQGQQAYESSIKVRKPLLTTLDGLTESASGPIPVLPEDDQSVSELVAGAKQSTERLKHAFDIAQRKAADRVDALLRVIRREEFATLPSTGRNRFAAFSPEELIARSGEFIQQCDARHHVLQDEITKLAEDKDIVIRQLDGVAREALRLLAKAERASVMPEAFPGWAGLPFLKITAHPIQEAAARRDRLGVLIDRLVQEKAIPDGAKLASAAVRELGGAIRATLLKPEDPLRPDRHNITEFGTFSGGEKMTAAILLYVTLAQLRARGRDDFGREREAGLLILDNPFGTASKREFVELQLRVAQQMAVQLIYMTGVNDLGALEVLPRILRLRKRHRDRRSGDLLVTEDEQEEYVEGVQANLRS